MDDSFFRLLWALPLVIGIGYAALYSLKRLGLDGFAARRYDVAPVIVSRTSLTEHTQAIVLELDGQRYMVIESHAHLSTHLIARPDPALRSAWPWHASRTK